MTMKKKVTYFLMLSAVFPKGHPSEGEPTGFKDKLLKEKIHTFRGNADLWEKRAKKINAGEAELSIRQWSGKPYEKGSHQIEIARITKLGTQRATLSYRRYSKDGVSLPYLAEVEGGRYHDKVIEMDKLAANDGLSLDNFRHWFACRERKAKDFHGVLLHFTDFRY